MTRNMGAAESQQASKVACSDDQRRKGTKHQHYRFEESIHHGLKPHKQDIIDQITSVLCAQPKSTFRLIEDDVGDDLEDVHFPYENAVFEGGGSQGTAYIGAVRELERLGHLKKLRRFGGASVGAVTATMLAVGHNSEELLYRMNNGPNFPEMLDARCGACSIIPNFFRLFGWHPGKVCYEWLGDVVAAKLGNPDATFRDLYEKTGRELCVVVTNLSLKMEEYCHVKTTPDLPIRAAVRMSMAIPGVFVPYQRIYADRTDIYVDGGVICNYPVHCFDGWWLSMEPHDAYLRRMQSLTDVGKLLMKKERFGTFNKKTLGFIIFSDYDQHVLSVNSDLIAPSAPIPDTELARAHLKLKKKREFDLQRHQVVTEAMSMFLKVLNDNNLDGNDTINMAELQEAISKTDEFTSDHIKALFGDRHSSASEIFSELDFNDDGEIDFPELMSFAERRGVGIQSQIIGAGWTDIKTPRDFIDGLFRALLMNVKRAFLESEDNERTVMINTVYIKSLDFESEQEDIDFLLEQGRRGIRAFLRHQKNRATDQKETTSL